MTTVCSCASPPGGAISCPDDCFAYCRISRGMVEGGCVPPVSRKRPRGDELLDTTQTAVEQIQTGDVARSVVLVSVALSGNPRDPLEWGYHSQVIALLELAVDEGQVILLNGYYPTGSARRMPDCHFSLQLCFPANWSLGRGGSDNSFGGLVG